MVKTIELTLSNLKQGLPGISPPMASAHLEACLVCLFKHGHKSGVRLETKFMLISESSDPVEFSLTFEDSVNDQMLRTWNDPYEAVEFGAGAIAFLSIQAITNYTVIKRSRRGTGFDYWLGKKSNNSVLPFQEKARLEISGIFETDKESIIQARLREKLAQTSISDNLKYPAYVIVVEFSRPIVYVAEKS